MPLGKQGH